MAKGRSEKFFFDMNVFDENGMEQRELEENKPPPSFGIEIVESAREEGFKKGKQTGLAESKASRDQHVAKILEKIAQDTVTLFEAEDDREKIYEMESTRLTLAIFKKLFPLYSEKYGMEELKGVLTSILQKTAGQSEIVIDVHPDYASEVEKHIENISSTGETTTKIAVRGNDSLSAGDCRLSWSDGGGVRNSLEQADKIVAALEEALAAEGGNVHDNTIEDKEPAPETLAPQAQEPDKKEAATKEPQSGESE
ncbi:MAG: flagellar assembly protein FliH [Micavibrio sp.]|nr:MAG: flagellar assembly protein FliH [Micavibrio sp.]